MSRSVLTSLFRQISINSLVSIRRPILRKIIPITTMSGNGVIDSKAISEITAKEKELTGQNRPVKGGPTAQAQKHASEPITSKVISDVTQGEKNVTGNNNPVQGGPTALAQSMAASVSCLFLYQYHCRHPRHTTIIGIRVN